MSNDEAQAIVAALILIVLMAIIFIPFAIFIGYTLWQKRKRDQIREAIIRERAQLISSNQRFAVRYASELRFRAFFKIFPWEGAGVLVTVPGSTLFLGRTLSGSPLEFQFAPGNSTVTWLGKAPWPNGAVSWFYVTTATEKHYFTSETGFFVFGSHKTTKAIYDEVSKSFLAHSAHRE